MHPFAALQHVLPQHALSRCLGAFGRSRSSWLKRLLIDGFIAAYAVDMSECEAAGAADFACFNDFFTRRLRDGTRPISKGAGQIVSPADGTVSQAGAIHHGQLLQAKGHRYSVADLLGDATFAESFSNGSFVTIYLAPHNYHRVHAPCDARLLASTEIPGRLFSVNALTERQIAGLFARNERLVLRLQTSFGECALVLVGALIVASIEMAWGDGPVSPYRQRRQRMVKDVRFQRGDEIGAFLIGSTVIVLFPEQTVQIDDRVATGATLEMGEPIAMANSG